MMEIPSFFFFFFFTNPYCYCNSHRCLCLSYLTDTVFISTANCSLIIQLLISNKISNKTEKRRIYYLFFLHFYWTCDITIYPKFVTLVIYHQVFVISTQRFAFPATQTVVEFDIDYDLHWLQGALQNKIEIPITLEPISSTQSISIIKEKVSTQSD